MMPSGEDKTINVIVKYLSEGNEEAVKKYNDFAAAQLAQGKTLNETNAAFIKQNNLASDSIKNLSNQIKTASKEPGPSNPGGPLDPDKIQKSSQSVRELTDEFRGLRYAGMGLTQLGTLLTVGGGLLTAGIVKNAQDYVKYVGQSNELGQQWANTQEQIKQSSLQIGQTAASIILPAMQTGAAIMQQIASFVQQNPWIVQAALGVGVAMTVVGSTLMIVGRIVSVIADMGLMMAMIQRAQAQQLLINASGGVGAAEYMPGGAGSVLGSQLGMSGGALGTAAVGGILVAGVAYQLTALETVLRAGNDAGKAFEQELVNLGIISKDMASGFDSAKNAILGLVEKIPLLGSFFSSVYGSTAGPTPTATQSTIIPQQAVQDFINYQQQLNTAQQNYSQQRSDIITQYEQQVVDTTQSYEQQRADIVQSYSQNVAKADQSFSDQQAKALASYQDNVAKTIRDFNLQQQRAAQQHAIEMQRLAEEHNIKMQDLAASRDALGLVKEQQSYQMQVQQKNQDYAIQRAQARQDEQIKLADMRQSFEQQQAEAQQAHQQQLADMAQQEQDQLAKLDANHLLEMQKLDQQEKDKLQKLDDQYAKEVQDYQQAFVDRINAIDSAILGDTAAYQQYLQNEAVQFQAWIQNFQQSAANAVAQTLWFGSTPGSTGTITGFAGGYQYGGYATFFGAGETALPEYVMNSSTVRAAESMMGSRLTQAGLLSSIMAGRMGNIGGGRSMQINVSGRSLSVTEIRNEVANALDARLSDLLPAFGV